MKEKEIEIQDELQAVFVQKCSVKYYSIFTIISYIKLYH